MKRGLKASPIPAQKVLFPFVEESSPMKRGLKGYRRSRENDLGPLVEESSPMKRGLKAVLGACPPQISAVEESSPMKRGLKAEGNGRALKEKKPLKSLPR